MTFVLRCCKIRALFKNGSHVVLSPRASKPALDPGASSPPPSDLKAISVFVKYFFGAKIASDKKRIRFEVIDRSEVKKHLINCL